MCSQNERKSSHEKRVILIRRSDCEAGNTPLNPTRLLSVNVWISLNGHCVDTQTRRRARSWRRDTCERNPTDLLFKPVRVFDAQVFLLHYVTLRVKEDPVFCWIHSFSSQFTWTTENHFDSVCLFSVCGQPTRDRLNQVKVTRVHRGQNQGRDLSDPQGSMISVTLCEILLNLRLPVWRFVSVQVTVSMYKRGAQGWLGKPLIATATIPSSTRVIFRIRGEITDAKIPAGSIRSITLSIWSSSLIRRNLFWNLLCFCNSSRWSSSLLARLMSSCGWTKLRGKKMREISWMIFWCVNDIYIQCSA